MKINIGIVGVGHWGKNYVRIFRENPNCRVAKIAEIDVDKIKFIKSLYPDAEVVTDYNELLNSSGIDAVVISTPTSTHAEIALKSLKAKKHTLVEKPITTRSEDAIALYELAKKQAVVLMVGHTFLYNNGVRKLKELISSQSFGKCYYIESRRNHLGLIREDVPVHWDLAPHDISITNFILNKKPFLAQATAGYYLSRSKADMANITLHYSDGIVAIIQVSWIDAHKVREIYVIGSRQRIVFNDLDNIEPIRIYEKGVSTSVEDKASSFGEFKYLVRDGDIISPRLSMNEPLKTQCEHFIECILNKKEPLTNGLNGYEIVRVLESIDESIKLNGQPIEIRY